MSNRSCIACSKTYHKRLYDARIAASDGSGVYEGSPCAKCGSSERRVGSSICVNCQHDYDIARRRENGDAERERSRSWGRNNPDKKINNNRQRRARSAQAVGSHSVKDVEAIFAAQNGTCAYCAKAAEHLDHVVPLCRGGTNWPFNLQWLCAFHNVSKGALTDKEYRSKMELPIVRPVAAVLWSMALAA